MTQNPKTFPHQQQHLFLQGPSGQLEVITTWPKTQSPKAVSIICHPHPLYEGSMNNKVVTTIARACDRLGLATVRFNYRGVGKSAGEYGEMVGEIQDLLAVVDWVHTVLAEKAVWLAGFSFGSFIAASVANQVVVERLISVAPAVNHADYQVLTKVRCPWLMIQGDQDEVVPPSEVIEFAKNPPVPIEFILLKGVSHFFHGKLTELSELLIKKLS